VADLRLRRGPPPLHSSTLDVGNRTEHSLRTDRRKRAGSGMMSTRTRVGRSILEGDWRGDFRLATDQLVFRSVRPIEPCIFLSTPSGLLSRCPTICRAAAAVRQEEQPITISVECERTTQPFSPGQESDSSPWGGALPSPQRPWPSRHRTSS